MKTVAPMLALAAILALGYIMRRREAGRTGTRPTAALDEEAAALELAEAARARAEEDYFSRARMGERELKLLRAYFPADITLLGSLFASAGIPFRKEFERYAAIQPGVRIPSYNEVFFYVLEADLEDALAVAADFLAAKAATAGKPGARARLRGIAELVVGGWSAPDYSQRNSVDILQGGRPWTSR